MSQLKTKGQWNIKERARSLHATQNLTQDNNEKNNNNK